MGIASWCWGLFYFYTTNPINGVIGSNSNTQHVVSGCIGIRFLVWNSGGVECIGGAPEKNNNMEAAIPDYY